MSFHGPAPDESPRDVILPPGELAGQSEWTTRRDAYNSSRIRSTLLDLIHNGGWNLPDALADPIFGNRPWLIGNEEAVCFQACQSGLDGYVRTNSLAFAGDRENHQQTCLARVEVVGPLRLEPGELRFVRVILRPAAVQ